MNHLVGVDVLIVGRGGGSLEDLWPFNEEVVARAVYRSKIPVISAVGHETDWSICDFVADLRAPTPSAAAELVVASADELHNQVAALSHRLRLTMENRLTSLDGRLEMLRRSLHDPRTMLGHLAQRMDDLTIRLEQALQSTLSRRRQQYERLQGVLRHNDPQLRIGGLRQRINLLSLQTERLVVQSLDGLKQEFGDNTARLEVLSPLKTLARGYAIASRPDTGRVVLDAASMNTGDPLLLTLGRGRLHCRVEASELPE
jgi:exodeoxyribonuclease VII large subunit